MGELVLDKSYLDGASEAEVADVCDRYTALMPQELFFEMMTTRSKSQRRCFSKLPDRDSPVALIPPVGALVEFERHTHQPCAPLSRHRVDGRPYVFNRRLRDGTFVPSVDDARNLAAWQAQVEADTKAFMTTCLSVSDVFPHLARLGQPELAAAVEATRQRIATDLRLVRTIYGAGAPSDAPPADRIEPHWAVFRMFQCRLLAAVRMFGRYQGAIPQGAGAKFWRDAEHCMHDIYYVVLGALAEGLATLDNEPRDDFLLVCPGSVAQGRGVFIHAEA
jgi:hypothetical protein